MARRFAQFTVVDALNFTGGFGRIDQAEGPEAAEQTEQIPGPTQPSLPDDTKTDLSTIGF